MFFRLAKSLFVALFLVVIAADSFARSISVPLGRSELVEVAVPMGEVIIADPEIADIYVHGKHKVSVMGKKLGNTTIRLFDKKHRVIYSADVAVGHDLPAIKRALKDLLPYESIGLKMVNTNIALVGEVASVVVADRAVRIVEEYVEPTVGENSASTSAPESERSKVLNFLTITSGQQVMLRVRVGEIRRTALKRLGVNMEAVKTGGSSIFSIGTGTGQSLFDIANGGVLGQFSAVGSATQNFGTVAAGRINSSGNGVVGLLDALEENGLFKTLAEPNLVAVSGEEAQFLAGGEFPVPVPQDLGTISIEYKPFGVSVNFKPLVLSENRIRIAVEPEVSEIDNDASLNVQGFSIPSLTTRRAKTTIELAPGESFMIAGLIKDNMSSKISQLPGVGEIPILSALFRSVEFQREETELILVVTPYLVDPMSSADVRLPTDDLRPASVMEGFFYGALGSLSGDTRRISQAPSLEGPIGFMVD